MKENEKGFFYPHIEEASCVHCGKCSAVCECNPQTITSEHPAIKAYVLRLTDQQKRMRSQSGALFQGVAEKMLEDGGVCYGAAVCKDLAVRQIRVDAKTDLPQLFGSKYVQSDVGDSYILTELDLKSGKKVLYSGTSCMIAGLYRYLEEKRVDTSGLLTCDFICHGVPSPLFYHKNLERIEKQFASKITSFDFRDKRTFGWGPHTESCTMENGTVHSERVYATLFYSHMILRESCYSCPYLQSRHRPADITMGDYWGVKGERSLVENDFTGWSIALVHSEKGLQAIDFERFEAIETDASRALEKNTQKPIPRPKQYERFWREYKKKGFLYSLRRYTEYGGASFKIRREILKRLGRW